MDFIQKIKSVSSQPRKVRYITRQVKHWPIKEASERFALIEQGLKNVLVKGIGAAIDRLKTNNQNPDEYIIKRITCDEGIKMKRRLFVSRGRSRAYTKQRSHIQIFVGQIDNDRIKKSKKLKQKIHGTES